MTAPRLSVQLYSVRDQLDDLEGTLARIAGLGIDAVEFHERFDGITAYERFVAALDDRVALELDVFWAACAGQDVPALLQTLGPRVVALHVKDGVLTGDPFASGASYEPEQLDLRAAGDGESRLKRTRERRPDGTSSRGASVPLRRRSALPWRGRSPRSRRRRPCA